MNDEKISKSIYCLTVHFSKHVLTVARQGVIIKSVLT